jgi:transposase
MHSGDFELARQQLLEAVKRKHASSEVKLYCIHAYMFLGFKKQDLAQIFQKDRHTIGKWIEKFYTKGVVSRKQNESSAASKFDDDHKRWIKEFVDNKPTSYLREIAEAFQKQFGMTIAQSTVFYILTSVWKYTRQVVERRAMEIRMADVIRFSKELNMIRPTHEQLLFLDEFGFDNRDMLRKFGWFVKGRPYMKSSFQRRLRNSFLGFCGVNGLVEAYHTEGTFDRQIFFRCVRTFVNSGKVQPYPGRYSVWILDGAAIHCDPNIVFYLRSVGLVVIFNAAYCPFYNPIEFLFGYIKHYLQENYDENPGTEMLIMTSAFSKYCNFDMSLVFSKCGYHPLGYFEPWKNMKFESDQGMDDTK